MLCICTELVGKEHVGDEAGEIVRSQIKKGSYKWQAAKGLEL